MNNERGNTLIQVLIALGILGVVVSGVMTVGYNMMEISKTADVKAEVQEQIFIAQANLGVESNCTANFKGLKIGDSSIAITEKIMLSEKPGVYTLSKDNYVFPSQSPVNGNKIELSSLSIKKYPGSNTLALLAVDFTAKGNILGGSLRTRSIPLQVSLDANGKIVKCASAAFNTDLSSLSDDDDDSGATTSQRTQGKACPSGPPGGNSTANYKAEIEKLCDLQKYPVTSGMVIPEATINNCLKRVEIATNTTGGTNYQYIGKDTACEAMLSIAFAESYSSKWRFVSSDIRLKNRTNYDSAEACKKQKVFSEGDNYYTNEQNGLREFTVQTASCVNSNWSGSSTKTEIAFSKQDSNGNGNQ